MASPLRIGLIGSGRIGQVHAKSIAATSNTQLTMVADVFIEGAEKTAAEYGAVATSNPQDIFTSGNVDAVIIASPTSTHIDLIESAIDANIPALCEKPIDLDIRRVDGIRAKAAASKTPIVLGFNRRFDPNFAEVQRKVRAGAIGKLEQLVIISRDVSPAPKDYLAVSGGIFRDMTIHDFDMARFFVPNIVEVTARGGNQFSSDIKDLGDYDSTSITLRGAGDEMVTIINSRHASYGYDQRLEAFGSEGMLRVENMSDTNVRLYRQDQVEVRDPYQNFFLERYMASYQIELQAFISRINGEESDSPTFEDGRAALVLADAAEESAKIGKTVAVNL